MFRSEGLHGQHVNDIHGEGEKVLKHGLVVDSYGMVNVSDAEPRRSLEALCSDLIFATS